MTTPENTTKPAARRPAKKRTAARKRTAKAKSKTAPAAETTSRRATRLALNLIEFQKVTFDNAARLLGAVQQQTEKAVRQLAVQSSWMPKEGQQAVDEWVKTMRRAREDFKKTVDKSFDLVSEYLKRLEKEGTTKASTADRKKAAKRRAEGRPA